MSLGEELVVNGGFDTDSDDWVKGNGWSISGGKAVFLYTPGGLGSIGQSITETENGKLYQIQYTLSGLPEDEGKFVVLDFCLEGVGVIKYQNGTYTVNIQSYEDGGGLSFIPVGFQLTDTFTLDNVSVREVLPDGGGIIMSGIGADPFDW